MRIIKVDDIEGYFVGREVEGWLNERVSCNSL